MAKAILSAADTAVANSIGRAQDRAASVLADVLSPILMTTLDDLSAHKQAWEGGAFAVMYKATSNLTPEQRDALPDPKAKTGNNPAYYYAPVLNTDTNKETIREHYFYKIMVNAMPGIIAKKRRIEMLERSMKSADKVNTSDIPQEVKDTDPAYRQAEITRLGGEITNAVSATVSAFELYFQIKAFETLKNVEVEIIYAIGKDGELMDGQEGRPYQVENTKTPIIVRSTVKGRQAIDNKRIGLGTFKKYNVASATENGGSFAALEKTLEREQPNAPPIGAAAPQNIKTADTFFARVTDMHSYLDDAWTAKDKEQFEAVRKGAKDSDDYFTSLFAIRAMLNDIVGSPQDVARYAEIMAKAKAAEVKAA